MSIRPLARCLMVTWVLLASATLTKAQTNVLTNRYDGQRTGANLAESTLTPVNVNASQFGKLYAYPVDGAVYAQPLYVSGVSINGVLRNVLYVATMNDKVYAFDADGASLVPLWTRSFVNPPSVIPVPVADITGVSDMDIVGNIGVMGTPVIDRQSGTLYLVARTKENGNYPQRLHALDIATGAERPGSPVNIAGSVPGNAQDATAGANGLVVTFDPKRHNQRPGLALTNGVVLVAWAGHQDMAPYHGWIMGFDATTLARVGTFLVTRDSYGGGIWQGGRAPTLDGAGNAYFATGNGDWNGTRNFGDSLLKFSVSRSGMALIDYFTPGNEEQLDRNDDDLSGSGFTLLPGTNLLLGGGKEGVLYLLKADALGGKTSDDKQVIQKITVNGGHVMGGPVYWRSSSSGPRVYNWSEDDVLKAYLQMSDGKLDPTPLAQGVAVSPGHPGGSLTVSANGSASNTGIIWASIPTNRDGIHGLVAGMLRAYDAETLREIWTSEQNAARDRVGTLMKFVPPVVVNGRVYLPNQNNQVAVYGLLPRDPTPSGFGAIGIDFVGNNPVAMSLDETAGVVHLSHWNNAAGAARTAPLPLVDDTGRNTTTTVTWASNNTWATPITDQPGNSRMMKGYLDTSSTSVTTVTVTGLVPRAYDVYVYADGDNRSYWRSGAYSISGPGITSSTVNLTDAANTNFSSMFVEARASSGNFVKFTINATGFTLTARPAEAATTTRRAPVSGIQIVPRDPPPQVISVNFVGSSPVPMAPGEIAGVVARSKWNNALGASSTTPLMLVNESGASTTATVRWASNNVWATPIADQGGNARLMKGYLDTSSTSVTTVTVDGLASNTYDVYVYADGDNRSYARTAAYTITGPGITSTTTLTDAASTNFSGSFSQALNSAGNYVKFRVSGSTFSIAAKPLSGGNTTLRAPINGIQIVPAGLQ